MLATAPRWMKITLWMAGLYNIFWGVFVILFPNAMFLWTGMEPPLYPQLWQCIGMIVGVYGLGYIIAGFDPVRHWPIVLVGFLGKIFGPIGFAGALIQGTMPLAFGLNIVTNDLIWWVPFALILLHALEHELGGEERQLTAEEQSPSITMKAFADQHGRSLDSLSREKKTMVVFLRHAGCTFCREALADLQTRRADIEAKGIQIALVHMGSEEQARVFVTQYGLEDLPRFRDPEKILYRSFGLKRGTWMQLVGPAVWWRGFQAAILNGHGVGKLVGDGMQLAGVFMIYGGNIIERHQHQSSADRPDYEAIATCEISPSR